MNLDAWFDHARRDAAEQGRPALAPLLDMLQRATRALRAADWAQEADDGGGAPETRPPSASPTALDAPTAPDGSR